MSDKLPPFNEAEHLAAIAADKEGRAFEVGYIHREGNFAWGLPIDGIGYYLGSGTYRLRPLTNSPTDGDIIAWLEQNFPMPWEKCKEWWDKHNLGSGSSLRECLARKIESEKTNP